MVKISHEFDGQERRDETVDFGVGRGQEVGQPNAFQGSGFIECRRNQIEVRQQGGIGRRMEFELGPGPGQDLPAQYWGAVFGEK
jgi:hypothetical protein